MISGDAAPARLSGLWEWSKETGPWVEGKHSPRLGAAVTSATTSGRGTLLRGFLCFPGCQASCLSGLGLWWQRVSDALDPLSWLPRLHPSEWPPRCRLCPSLGPPASPAGPRLAPVWSNPFGEARPGPGCMLHRCHGHPAFPTPLVCVTSVSGPQAAPPPVGDSAAGLQGSA